MSATLEMPVRYAEIGEEEFDEVDGGAAIGAVLAIISGVIGAIGASYATGQIAGERAYYAGLRNPEYQAQKWGIRGYILNYGGPVFGGAFALGFENKFYSMI
ncbi:MAG: hypothetical protein JWR04_452 [Rhodoglobus sp.]|jgi:hypothetical protein|nr:hypothetical protein [Rhodoglobus sp.]